MTFFLVNFFFLLSGPHYWSSFDHSWLSAVVSAYFCGNPAALPTHSFVQPTPRHTLFLTSSPFCSSCSHTAHVPDDLWYIVSWPSTPPVSRFFTFVLRQTCFLQSSASKGLQTACTPIICSVLQGFWQSTSCLTTTMRPSQSPCKAQLVSPIVLHGKNLFPPFLL